MYACVCKLSFSFVVIAHFNACQKKRGAGVKGVKMLENFFTKEAAKCLPEPTGLFWPYQMTMNRINMTARTQLFLRSNVAILWLLLQCTLVYVTVVCLFPGCDCLLLHLRTVQRRANKLGLVNLDSFWFSTRRRITANSF